MKDKIKKFKVSLTLAPFEAMFGFICIYSGLAGIFNFGIINNIFSNLLNIRFLLFFNLIYFLSGIGIFFGVGLKKGNLEAFGLIVLATTLLIRTVIFGWLLGLNPIIVNAYVSNCAFAFGCSIRLITIFKNNQVLKQQGKEAKLLMTL